MPIRQLSKSLDAIISLPIGNEAVAEPHSEVAQSGKKLILVDNAPTGLLPGRDFECLVSADDFGLGRSELSCFRRTSPPAAP